MGGRDGEATRAFSERWQDDWIVPHWQAPRGVRAVMTTRFAGQSAGAWASCNLGRHVGDEEAHVLGNRALLVRTLGLIREPLWLAQVHGADVVRWTPEELDVWTPHKALPQVDASVTSLRGPACVVMVADCLPVLLCDRSGAVVGAAHVGWRGLVSGVLDAAVQAMEVAPGELMAWLGPCIGAEAFEVGPEVREACVEKAACLGHDARPLFVERPRGKWLADLTGLARQALGALGVDAVYVGEADNRCTVSDARRYYSYRRDGVTGRMAALIWLEGE